MAAADMLDAALEKPLTSSAQTRGDSFERSIVGYLRDELGQHLTRPRCGETHDRGDISGVPAWTFELKSYTDMMRGIREGIAELANEQATAGTPYGAAIVKRARITDPAHQLFVMRLGDAVPLIRESGWPT